MTQDKLIEAAKSVIARWDSPNWKDGKHTRDYIYALRDAVQDAERILAIQAQPTPSQSMDEPSAYMWDVDKECFPLQEGAWSRLSERAKLHKTPLYTKPQPTSQDLLDAEKYRYMRENDMVDIYSDFITYKLNPFSFDYVDLDAEINAKMKESKKWI